MTGLTERAKQISKQLMAIEPHRMWSEHNVLRWLGHGGDFRVTLSVLGPEVEPMLDGEFCPLSGYQMVTDPLSPKGYKVVGPWSGVYSDEPVGKAHEGRVGWMHSSGAFYVGSDVGSVEELWPEGGWFVQLAKE